MKVDEKNARGSKEDLHGKADKELKNKRHSHVLLTISVAWERAIFMVVCTHGPVLKRPTIANHQETAYEKEVFDDPQTSFLDWKRCKIMILALIHGYLVFGGYGSIFDIEQFTYFQISKDIKIEVRSSSIVPAAKALIAQATPKGRYVNPETRSEM
jgi:hypothetical protein